MYELPPAGFSEAVPAFLKIAKAWWPESFQPTDTDAEELATWLHIKTHQPKALDGKLTRESLEALKALEQAFHLVRTALAEAKFPAFYLDKHARMQIVLDYRHWATQSGHSDLLLGIYFDVLRLSDRPILLRNNAIEAFLPKVTNADTTARGRDALAGRLRALMQASPNDPFPKEDVLEALAPDFPGLGSNQREHAWTEAAQAFPTWSRSGRRRKRSRQELIAALNRRT